MNQNSNWDKMRENIIGFGDSSNRKSYFPELKRKIRELEHTRNDLRQSEQNLNNLFNTIGDAIIIHLDDGSVVEVNDTMLSMFHVSRDTFRNYTIHDYSAPPHMNNNSVEEVISKLKEDGKILFNWKARRPTEDTIFDVEVSLREYSWYGKAAIVAVVRDTTERKQAEKALQQSEQRLRAIINSVPSLIFVKNTNGKFLTANKAVTDCLNMPQGELNGKSLEDIYIKNKDIREILKNVDLGHNNGLIVTKRYLHDNGNIRWLQIINTKCPESIFGEPAIVGIAVDITERKQAEEELQKHKDNLEEMIDERTKELARSNTELEQFAYIASHDLQEPLRMVTSYMHLLEKRYKQSLDDDAQDFINFAVDGAKRMQILIQDLLRYSRVTSTKNKLEPTSCQTVLKNALYNLEVAIKDTGAKITYTDLPVVMGDSTLLIQLFQNLIGNAIKFHGERTPEIHISTEKQKNLWKILIKDNGIGIKEEYFKRIFQIFQRLHGRNQYEGTGIGLAVCKKIIEQHNGTIDIKSEPNKGTIFSFTLHKVGEIL